MNPVAGAECKKKILWGAFFVNRLESTTEPLRTQSQMDSKLCCFSFHLEKNASCFSTWLELFVIRSTLELLALHCHLTYLTSPLKIIMKRNGHVPLERVLLWARSGYLNADRLIDALLTIPASPLTWAL